MAQSHPGENSKTLDHLGETGSELKLTAFLEKSGQTKRSKVSSSSQTCHVSERGWRLLICQLLVGPLQRTHLQKQADPDCPVPEEEPGLKHPEWILPQSYLVKEVLLIATQCRISTLRTSKYTEKALVRRDSTWIKSEKSE
jgi:hypothetical protein